MHSLSHLVAVVASWPGHPRFKCHWLAHDGQGKTWIYLTFHSTSILDVLSESVFFFSHNLATVACRDTSPCLHLVVTSVRKKKKRSPTVFCSHFTFHSYYRSWLNHSRASNNPKWVQLSLSKRNRKWAESCLASYHGLICCFLSSHILSAEKNDTHWDNDFALKLPWNFHKSAYATF